MTELSFAAVAPSFRMTFLGIVVRPADKSISWTFYRMRCLDEVEKSLPILDFQEKIEIRAQLIGEIHPVEKCANLRSVWSRAGVSYAR